MSDTATLKPNWQLILGMLPSLNQSLIILVTALASVMGTIATQKLTAKPAEAAKSPPPTVTERVIERQSPVDLAPIATKLDDVLKRLEALEKKPKSKSKAAP